MVNKLISRAEFARLAKVSGAAVTKACDSTLQPALIGKRIDVTHQAAIDYLVNKEKEQTETVATGLDNRYEEAVGVCQEKNRFTTSYIQRELKIGYNRAKAILEIMRINGLIPVKGEAPPNPKPAPIPPKIPHVRGTAAAKETRKREPHSENQILEIPENIEAFADMTLREILERFGTDTRFVDYLSATQKIEAINEKRLKNAQTKGVLISRELVRVGVIDTFNSAHLRLMKDGSKSIAAGVLSKHVSGAELPEIEAFISDILGSFIKPIKNKINRVLKDA